MGRALIVSGTILVLAIVLGWWLGWFLVRGDRQENRRAGRPLKGDLNARQERELQQQIADAYRIFAGLGNNTTVEQMSDPELLRASTRREVDAWLARHRFINRSNNRREEL